MTFAIYSLGVSLVIGLGLLAVWGPIHSLINTFGY